MKNNKKRILHFFSAVLIGICIVWLTPERQPKEKETAPRDYAEIAADGILRVATEYNSQSFYVDGDTLSGLHYRLIQAFARRHGLQVEFLLEMKFDVRLEALASGRCDIVVSDIPATSQLKDSLLLTAPILLSKQVLVQRKAVSDSDSIYIKSQLELAGKTLYVPKGAPVIQRIHHLGNEIADTIYIKEIERYGAEQLIAMVAHGDIDYTVCDEQIAHIAADSLPQIDLQTAISFTQFYTWAVHKKSPALRDSINAWLLSIKSSK